MNLFVGGIQGGEDIFDESVSFYMIIHGFFFDYDLFSGRILVPNISILQLISSLHIYANALSQTSLTFSPKS